MREFMELKILALLAIALSALTAGAGICTAWTFWHLISG
jgi:hypothetical protein